MKERFGNPRRTTIEEAEFEADIEDLIQREDMVVTVTQTGYIKRVPLSTYRAQARGGKGRAGMGLKEEDTVTELFVASTHSPMLFFSSRGLVYKMKVYRLPLATPQARGKALVNLLPLQDGETISTVLTLPEDEERWGELDVLFATSKGNVRRNRLSDFSNIRANGLIAMKLDEEGERLIAVRTATDQDDVLLATRGGKCIRFSISDVRVFSGRTSTGVRGIRLSEGDEVIAMSILHHVDATPEERAAYLRQANAIRRAAGEDAASDEHPDPDAENGGSLVLVPERFAELAAKEQFILTVSQRGYGKRTSSHEYRVTGRGGQGIWNMEMNERNGLIAAAFPVGEDDQVMLVSDGGQMIRMPVHDVRIAGRKTLGVTLFRVSHDERVVSVARVSEEAGETGLAGNGSGNGAAEGGEAGTDAAVPPAAADGAE
jgi:DNA gyrase subunit A